MAFGGLYSTFFTYINDLCPSRRRAEGLAIFGLSGFIGLAIGPMLAEWFEIRYGFIALFQCFTVISFVLFLFLLVLPESASLKPKGTKHASMLAQLRRVVGDPNLFLLWLPIFAFGCTMSVHRTFLAPMAREFQMGKLGYFFTTYALTAICLRLTTAKLPDQVGRVRMLIPAIFCQISGFIVLTLVLNQAGMIVAGILAGVGHSYMFPILNALVAEYAGKERLGMAISSYSMFMDGGAVLGNALLGIVAQQCGYVWMFRVMVTITLFCIIPLFWQQRNKLVNASSCS